jgi:signal transduction histidine kinase
MKKILVIDDDKHLRDMVRDALEEKGYEVIEAEDGDSGLVSAVNHLPDLVLCDVKMERVDGYGTLASLRRDALTASIPVILMTGLVDNAGMRHGMELGADDYLFKPFAIEHLYASVDTRLQKTQTLRQAAERKLADLRDNLSLMLQHELRTPLNGILAYGEILAAEAATLPPREIAEMGQVIYDSGKRLEHLVENCLIYAQIELLTSDPQKVNALRQKQTSKPARLIEERARTQAQLARRPSDLRLDISDQPVWVSEEYLGKIVDELVQNAFKFSSAGSPVHVTLVRGAAAATMTIADQGHGFSTEHITKVGAYMQFDRKLHEQQGLGLGLSIAKRLTELHGGTLAINSQHGGRTTVTVKLPQEPPDSSAHI